MIWLKIYIFSRKNSLNYARPKCFSFFAHNMYNPRPRKYNELPANDLSTKEDTTDMKKPLWFLLSSSRFCSAIFNFVFTLDIIFIVFHDKNIDHFDFQIETWHYRHFNILLIGSITKFSNLLFVENLFGKFGVLYPLKIF